MIRARAFAIDGVLAPSTFEVPAGAFALLAGPTGSGKSLLLHALAGLAAPSLRHAGALEVAGRDARATPAHELARDVALVFQDAAERHVAPDVASTLALRLENRGVGPDEGRPLVEAALHRLGLAGDRPTWELSDGEAKRVAIEAALLPEPRVLLLDEPLAHLDAGGRRAVRERLAALRGRATILVAEHRAGDFEPIADRRLEIARGRVAEVARARA